MKRLGALWLLAASLALGAQTLVVDNTLQDGIDCEGTSGAYATIRDALKAAGDGDTIKICAGDYPEGNLKIDHDVTITAGADASDPADVLVHDSNDRPIFRLLGLRKGVRVEKIAIRQEKSDKAAFAVTDERAENLTLSHLRIESEGIGIRVLERLDAPLFESLTLVTKNRAIRLAKIEKGGTFDHITAEGGGGDGIVLTDTLRGTGTFADLSVACDGAALTLDKVEDGVTIRDSGFTSRGDRGIRFNDKIAGASTLKNLSVRSGLTGIYFAEAIEAGLDIQESTIVSQNGRGIDFEGVTDGATFIENLRIETEKEGLFFADKAVKELTVRAVAITSRAEEGIYFAEQVESAVGLERVSVRSDASALTFAKPVKAPVRLKGVDFESETGQGLRFADKVEAEVAVEGGALFGREIGLFVDELAGSNVKVSGSSILSHEKEGIKINGDSDSALELNATCVMTRSSDRYALNLNIDSDKSWVHDDCFYAPKVENLAHAKRSGNDFGGNFWEGNSGDYTYNNVSDTTTRDTCPNACLFDIAPPRAEYRMDECMWLGSEGEIEERQNGYDGTAKGAVITFGGRIANGGDFRAAGVDDYALLDHRAMDGLDSFSVAVWVKTTQSHGFAVVAASNASEPNEAQLYIDQRGGESVFQGTIANRWTDIPLGVDLADGKWHHLVWTREGERQCIVVDGDAEAKRCETLDDTSGPLEVAEGGLVLGQEPDTLGGLFDPNQAFEGVMDELKIFPRILDDDEITLVYNRESGGRNWDGTLRAPTVCPSLEAEYRLDGCAWSTAERDVIDSADGHDGRITSENVTSVEALLCHGAQIPYNDSDAVRDAVDTGVVISQDVGDVGTILFWYRPEKGGSSGFLFDASDDTTDDIDINKAFYLYRSNDRLYVFFEDENDDNLRAYADIGFDAGEWAHIAVGWDAVENVVTFYKNGARVATHYQERALTTHLRTRYSLYIGDNRSDYHPSIRYGYSADGLIDEFKIFRGSPTRSQIAAIHDNEKSGKNWDGTARACPDCGGYMPKEGIFRAVDKVEGACDAVSAWEGNITTKRAGEAYTLTILARDSADGAPMDANITEVALLYYDNAAGDDCGGTLYRVESLCEGVQACGRTGGDGCVDLAVEEAKNGRAARCVQVRIRGVDANATAGVDANESNASDTFAIRPDRFLFLAPSPDANLTAQHRYTFSPGAAAVTSAGNETPDYNTTLTLDALKRMRTGEANASLAGTLDHALSAFADGRADLNLSFSDVAIVTLELNDTTWCAVDADDTPLSGRTIYGEVNVTFVPHRFELTFAAKPVMEDNDTADGFTYLSEDLNMSARLRGLRIGVKALGEAGGLLENFSNPMDRLFADPVDISPRLALPARHSTARTLGEPQAVAGADLNFSRGEVTLSYGDVAFNYARAYDAPLSPFVVSGVEANVTVALADSRYPEANGSVFSDFDGGATFYYGRFRCEDVATTETATEAPGYFEVYDANGSAFVRSFERHSLHWWRNAYHDTPASGRIREANATAGIVLGEGADESLSIRYDTYGPGDVKIGIESTTPTARTRTIHLDVDPWLWYVPEGFGGAYRYESGSDCSSHPCFTYTLRVPGGSTGVRSGETEGADFDARPIDANATYRRKEGVKLFR